MKNKQINQVRRRRNKEQSEQRLGENKRTRTFEKDEESDNQY